MREKEGDRGEREGKREKHPGERERQRGRKIWSKEAGRKEVGGRDTLILH